MSLNVVSNGGIVDLLSLCASMPATSSIASSNEGPPPRSGTPSSFTFATVLGSPRARGASWTSVTFDVRARTDLRAGLFRVLPFFRVVEGSVQGLRI